MTHNENLNTTKYSDENTDELYTQYQDIVKELQHYTEYFKNKIVYCNCDSLNSNFVHYFISNFEKLQIKKLIATCYLQDEQGQKIVIENLSNPTISFLNGNGDFASDECIEILKECDVVVSNPPFSLLRKYATLLIENKKDFLFIATQNAVCYKEIFPSIKLENVHLGFTRPRFFILPNGDVQKIGNICWLTTFPSKPIIKQLKLSKHYNPNDYPIYDNYNAINVDNCKNIPIDYMGEMGVPISYINHRSDDYSIEKCSAYVDSQSFGCSTLRLNGKRTFARLIIKKT